VIAYGFSLGAMNFLFYQALGRIPLGIAVALEFTGPLILAVVLSRKWHDGLWVALAALGVALLLPETGAFLTGIFPGSTAPTEVIHQGTLDPAGVAFALAAGAFWAGYIVFGRRVGLVIPSGQASAWGMIVAALVFAPLGSWTAPGDLWSWKYLPVGAAIGFFSSALPYSLEMYALKRVPTRSFGILMSLEPAVAALAGMVVLRETLDWTQTAAMAAIIVASLGTAVTSRR
jgi:inner membrane transporter RhtA